MPGRKTIAGSSSLPGMGVGSEKQKLATGQKQTYYPTQLKKHCGFKKPKSKKAGSSRL